jgi:MFS transporter, DHA1 family, multidrug resistance protein
MSNRFVILLTGLLLGLNAFANDVMLPAFAAIAADLNTPIESVQALIPVFLIAAGCGQLFSGPASDRFGRRPLMVSGLALFIAGTGICAIAQSILGLQVGRVVQGLGAAFGVVVARATLRDTQSGPALARSMALAMSIFSFGPIAAPLVGVGLLYFWGWRATFIGVLVVGVALLLLTLWGHRETHQRRNPHALEPSRMLEALFRVLKHPQSRRYLAVACLQQSLIIIMIANSPRLFKSAFDIEGFWFALLFALTALGIMVGQFTNHIIIAWLGTIKAARAAGMLVLVDCLAMALLFRMGWLTAPVFLVTLVIFNMGFLVVLANAASLVLDPHPEIAGLTASLFGFATQVSGSVIAMMSLGWIQGQMLNWTLLMAALSAAVVALLFAPMRHLPRGAI